MRVIYYQLLVTWLTFWGKENTFWYLSRVCIFFNILERTWGKERKHKTIWHVQTLGLPEVCVVPLECTNRIHPRIFCTLKHLHYLWTITDHFPYISPFEQCFCRLDIKFLCFSIIGYKSWNLSDSFCLNIVAWKDWFTEYFQPKSKSVYFLDTMQHTFSKLTNPMAVLCCDLSGYGLTNTGSCIETVLQCEVVKVVGLLRRGA